MNYVVRDVYYKLTNSCYRINANLMDYVLLFFHNADVK